MSGVLITGATGFFGHGLVRKLLENQTVFDRICIYSRGEHAQAAMREEFPDSRLRFFIGDVRDERRLERAMHGCSLVVHSAALKRIETCFYNPGELVKTNIVGAVNVIEAARDAGVAKVVALSSDKAYQPVSAYGQSKALSESLFLNQPASGTRYACVRYGNVWQSTGSVVPIWRDLIARGAKSVPVTDPDCTRFFMTRDEAVMLVWNTYQTMQGGELAIPDLPAYRLGDLAEAMRVNMDVRGLNNFEKKHESMSHDKCSADARRMTVADLREALTHG